MQKTSVLFCIMYANQTLFYHESANQGHCTSLSRQKSLTNIQLGYRPDPSYSDTIRGKEFKMDVRPAASV